MTSDLGFEFALAERLGMTVGTLREHMSSLEFEQWRAYDKWRQGAGDAQARHGSQG